MAIKSLSVAVVGADYPNKDGGNRRTEIAFSDPAELVELRAEPNNEHDEHAIAVFSARGFQIGYVSSQRAVYLNTLRRTGHALTAIFQDVAPWGAVVRVGIDCHPGLPVSASVDEGFEDAEGQPSTRAPTDDFWPDYLPPDD